MHLPSVVALMCEYGIGSTNLLIISKSINMETKQKELYEAPSTVLFEVKMEGLICGSPLSTSIFILGLGGLPENNYPVWTGEGI